MIKTIRFRKALFSILLSALSISADTESGSGAYSEMGFVMHVLIKFIAIDWRRRVINMFDESSFIAVTKYLSEQRPLRKKYFLCRL